MLGNMWKGYIEAFREDQEGISKVGISITIISIAITSYDRSSLRWNPLAAFALLLNLSEPFIFACLNCNGTIFIG